MPFEIATASDFLDLFNRVRLFAGGFPTIGAVVDPGTANTGDGTVVNIEGSNGTSPRETWTLTATSPTSFTVSGSVSGAQATPATVDIPYISDDGRISFTIQSGATAFISGDDFEIPVVAGKVAQGQLNKGDPTDPAPANTGDGTVNDHGGTGLPFLQPQAVTEVWTITLTAATTFDVSGTVSGAQGSGTVGTDFTSTNGFLECRVVAGGTPFVSGDNFTLTVTKGQPWEVLIGPGNITPGNGFIDAGVYPTTDPIAWGNGFALGAPTYLATTRFFWKVKGDLTITNGGVIVTGTGDGTLTVDAVATQADAETWTATFTSATAFDVTGATSGAQGSGTVGVQFVSTNGNVTFTITAGGTPFVATDTITFGIHNFGVSFEDEGELQIRQKPAGILLGPIGADYGGSSGDKILGTNVYNNAASNQTDGTLDMPSNFGAVWLEPGTWEIEVRYHFNTVTSSRTAQAGVGWKEPDDSAFTVIPNTEFANMQATWRREPAQSQRNVNNEADFDDLFLQKDMILKGKGLAGADEIFVGMRTLSRLDTEIFHWQLTGYTGFDTDPSFEWEQQIGSPLVLNNLSPVVVPLDDDPMDYWLVVNGRRIVVSMKVTTVFEAAYLGFMNPFATPAQFPYPNVIGGSLDVDLGLVDFAVTNPGHRSFPDPGTSSSSDGKAQESTLMMFGPETATWSFFMNRVSSVGNPVRATGTNIWPWSDADIDNMRDALNGDYQILPATLFFDNVLVDEAVLGVLDGIFHVSGFNNAAENTFVIAGDTYVVFQNTFRTDIEDFWALRLD